MFSIFSKSKPKLIDLIPDNYIDIHSHLLPGIDDGAKSLEDSQYLIEKLMDFGTKQLITTPHILKSVWNNTPEIIKSKLEETNFYLNNLQLSIPLKAAAEYMLDSYFMDLLQSEEKLMTLKENYLLVEMSYIQPPINLFDMLFEIKQHGYQPVLAHPERYLFYHQNYDDYKKLKRAGCFFQMNLLSTVGYYGKNVALITDKILADGFYDFVGSDVHHEKHIQSFQNKLVIKNHTPLKTSIDNNNIFSFS